ncbi:MAG: peptidoglycan DD-metalloendopeptidase family protein [Bacteroidota bacterium]|nr:peptidoglycan DD-metalloendopeptidase family protein [Bacteroidota bacterium]
MKKRKLLFSLIVLVLLSSLAVLFYYYQYKSETRKILLSPAHHVPEFAYKICIDKLDVNYGTVRNNENLSSILSDNLDPLTIDQIVKSSESKFDVRKIHPGNRYAIMTSHDSLHRTQYFVYEINPIDFVVVDLKDSIRVYTGKKDVVRKIREAKGIIYSSLWDAIERNNMNIKLALSLADVFAWTIDFYGLQRGDNFKVIYEELFVDNVSVGSDLIQAAYFSSGGNEFKAFYFNKGGDKGYYDEKGQSLQRAFLKAPLHFSRISSRFTKARFHPILKIFRPHYGVDYAAPRGTPVVALGNGKVTEAGWSGGFGRRIVIRHNSIYTTSYAHLSGFAQGIHAGSSVKQGELIGYVGSSGLATGPHLDFRVFKNGQPADPLKMESPATEPVQQKNMTDFSQIVKKMSVRLDSIQ